MSEQATTRNPDLYVQPDECNAAISFPDQKTRFECSAGPYNGRPHDESGAPVDRWHEYDDEGEQFTISWHDDSPWAYRFDRTTGRRLDS